MLSESGGVKRHLLTEFSGVAATIARSRHVGHECPGRHGKTGPRRGESVAEFAEHVRESVENR